MSAQVAAFFDLDAAALAGTPLFSNVTQALRTSTGELFFVVRGSARVIAARHSGVRGHK